MKRQPPVFLAFVNCATLLLAGSFVRATEWSGWTLSSPATVVSQDTAHIELTYATPEFQPIDVRPSQPMPLPADTQRVRFWFARLAGDFDLYVLLRDAKGDEHEARTDSSRGTFPGIRRFKLHEWSMWNHVESVSLAVPAPVDERVLPEFRALANASIWPRPLTLSGIRIKPAHDRRDNVAHGERDTIKAGKGHVVLTDLGLVMQDGFQADFSWLLADRWRWGLDVAPRIFLDDLTRRSGKIRYAVEMRRGYQGPVVWRTSGRRLLDRTQAMKTFADRIELPPVSKGYYFITTKTWLADDTLDTVRRWRLVANRGPVQDLPEVNSGIHWATGKPDHVFSSDTATARLSLHIPDGVAPNASTCHVRVIDWLQRPVFEKLFERRPTIVFVCPDVGEGTDYRASAELRTGDRVVDQANLHFGVASQAREPGPIPRHIPSRDDLLKSGRAVAIAEHWGSLMSTRYDWEPITVERTHEFDQWVDDISQLGFTYTSFNFGWGEVEPLPGVMRWAEIERRLDVLKAHGMVAFLAPAEWGHPLEWPRWVEYDPMLTQHGLPAAQSRTRNLHPSFTDGSAHGGELAWFKALAERFRDNPTVIGYRPKMGVYLSANKPEVVRSDYGVPMLNGLTEWLQERGEAPISIPKLFTLYPYSPARTGPDLSREWREFCSFRVHSYRDRASKIMEAFRSVDPVRQLHIYRSSTPVACEAAIPLLEDGGQFHDEGGPFYFHRAIESMCLQRGIPYTNEGHQFSPPSKALVDSGFFYGSCYDQGWCWLYRWNIGRHKDPRFQQLPQVLQFISTSLPHVEEWAAAAGDPQQVLVFGSRAQSLLADGRHGHFSTIAGIEVFTGLFSYHHVPAHFADEYTDWVDLAHFNVVFAVGETMGLHAIERLASYAEKGGKLVIVGPAGRFCADRPGDRELLIRRVGGLPNVRQLPAPSTPPPPPGAVSRAEYAFAERELDQTLAWAQVRRLVRTADPQFDCVRKRSRDGRRIYVAALRHWPGGYDNVWYDGEAEKRWGRMQTEVTVSVPEGRWRIEKFHRDAREMAIRDAEAGVVTFPADPAMVGELQLFRLSKAGGD